MLAQELRVDIRQGFEQTVDAVHDEAWTSRLAAEVRQSRPPFLYVV